MSSVMLSHRLLVSEIKENWQEQEWDACGNLGVLTNHQRGFI